MGIAALYFYNILQELVSSFGALFPNGSGFFVLSCLEDDVDLSSEDDEDEDDEDLSDLLRETITIVITPYTCTHIE